MGRRAGVALGVVSVVLAGQAWVTAAGAQPGSDGPIGQPRFSVVAPPPGAQARSTPPSGTGAIQTWTGGFSFARTSYPYTMVGTNPAAGSATTVVPVKVLPLRVRFADGRVLNGASRVDDVIGSPIFQDAPYASGTTQYADAMRRAEFWNKVSTKSPDYHVRLAAPSVLPTATLTVPVASGRVQTTSHGPVGLVDYNWFVTQAPQLLAYLDPSALLIVLVKDVYLTQGTGCCIIGFHAPLPSSPTGALATLAFASYISPGFFGSPTVVDVYALSHEIAEWMDDPFVNNVVPRWAQPGSGQCLSNLLEVGDPVEALANPGFPVAVRHRVFHVTDAAGVSWFSHRRPSTELNGAYSYLGLLGTASTLC